MIEQITVNFVDGHECVLPSCKPSEIATLIEFLCDFYGDAVARIIVEFAS